MKTLGLVAVLFARFDVQLARRGYVAKAGQMIDATFVEAPRQRNSREDNAKIKAGEMPDGWDAPEQAAKRRQKDLDTETRTAEDRKRPVYADSAYRSAEREADLAKQGLESQIHEKGTRAAPLTEDQKANNRKKSTVRARVEHIFGAQAAMDGYVIRTIGLERAKVKIGLLNLTYNMKRLVQLTAIETRRLAQRAADREGTYVPGMA